MKRLLKGGRVVDPAQGLDGMFDVEIDGEHVSRIWRDLPPDGAAVEAKLHVTDHAYWLTDVKSR